ncbi:rod shape-determining protein [Actinomadura viridis]|uniref:rod shape-determining protein n=1 Tax=Actinomadura viridis TaxID=58110 RepID=UPI00367B8399
MHLALSRLSDFPCRATAIDLGSATVRIHVDGRGIVASEPSAVARARDTGRVLATGTSALALAGRERGVRLVHPIRNGVPAEAEDTEGMLRALLRSHLRGGYMAKPRMAVTVPSGINQVELGAVRAVAYGAGARRLTVVPTPIAAAAGAGLPAEGEDVAIVADVGAHVTDVGVVLSGELLSSNVALVGGSTMDQAIIAHTRREYGLVIAPVTAEAAKLSVGSAIAVDDRQVLVHGVDVRTGLPHTAVLTSGEVHAAIAPALAAIVRAVHAAVTDCPPEMAGHFISAGITLTGGGARLPRLDELVQEETGLCARVAPNAADATVTGAAELLRPLRKYDPGWTPEARTAAL